MGIQGDSFQMVFHTPAEAVGWCLNVQSLLLTAPWPSVLEQHARTALRCMPSAQDPNSSMPLWRLAAGHDPLSLLTYACCCEGVSPSSRRTGSGSCIPSAHIIGWSTPALLWQHLSPSLPWPLNLVSLSWGRLCSPGAICRHASRFPGWHFPDQDHRRSAGGTAGSVALPSTGMRSALADTLCPQMYLQGAMHLFWSSHIMLACCRSSGRHPHLSPQPLLSLGGLVQADPATVLFRGLCVSMSVACGVSEGTQVLVAGQLHVVRDASTSLPCWPLLPSCLPRCFSETAAAMHLHPCMSLPHLHTLLALVHAHHLKAIA